jgi:hypothetical protein
MALVGITKPLMLVASPMDLTLVMRGLGELPAKDVRELLNRLEFLIVQNEQPPTPEPVTLKPVGESLKQPDEAAAPTDQ